MNEEKVKGICDKMDGASVLDESLDDTHSFLDMELEALQSIYINEIEVEVDSKSTTVSIDLHPATADKLDEQYVRMSLQFTLDEGYPEDIPKVKIRNPRGLSEEKINCVMKDLLAIAESKRGNSMLFEMIEAAKEHLTVGNRPCGECAICLHGFSDKDIFTKTECYHYFHSHCLARYSKYFLESSKDSETADPKSDAKSNELLCPMCRVPIQFQGDEKDYPLPNASDESNFTLTDEIVDLQKRMANLFQKQVEKGGIIDIEAEKNKFLIEISNVPTRVNNEEKLEQKQQVEYETTDKTDTSDQVDSPSREKRYNRDQNKRTDYRGRNRNFHKQNENWGNYRSGGRYNNRQSYDDFHGNHNRNKYDRYSAQRFDPNRGNFRKNNEDSKQFLESARNSELQSLDAAERQNFAGSSVQCEDTSEIVEQQMSDTKSKPTSSSPRYNRGYRRGNNYSYNSHYGDRRSDKSSFHDSQNSHVPNKQISVDNEDEDACKYEDREPKERTSEYGEYRKPNYRSDRYRPENNYIPRERYSDGRNSRRGGNVDDEDEDSKERIDYGEPRKPHYRSDKYRQDNYIPRERYSDGRNSQRGIAIDDEDGDTGKSEDRERTSEYSVRKPHYRNDRYRQDNDYNSKERYSDSRNSHRGGRGGYMRRGNYSHDPHFSGKNRYVDTDKDQYYADRDRNYRGRRMQRDDRYRGNTHDGYRQKNSRNYAANNYVKPTNEHYQTSTSENHESVDLSSRSHSSDSNHHSVDSGTPDNVCLDNVSSSSKYTKSLLDKTEAQTEVDSSDFDKKSSIKVTDKPAEDGSYIPPPTVMNEKPPASLRTALNPPPGFANPLKKVIYGRVFALFGFHRLDKIKAVDAIRLIGLDFLVVFSSVGVFISCEKLQKAQQTENTDTQQDGDVSRKPIRRRKKKRSEVLFWTGEVFVLLFLGGAGILHPSLLSAVYFLTFLFVCTWLACNKKIGRRYLQSKIPLLIFCSVHFVGVYLYQVDYVQDYLAPDTLTVRLLGLPDFVKTNCTEDVRSLVFNHKAWNVYASPFFILGLYCLLSLILRKQLFAPPVEEKYEPCMSRIDSKQSSQHSQGSVRRRKQSRRMTRGSEERSRVGRTPSVKKLLDEDHTGRSYRTIESGDITAKDALAIDPNGSVIWTSESDMPDGLLEILEEDKGTASKSLGSKLKKICTPILSALKLIAKGSYVATLIIMMTWSITYHSWLTFVLLLWSCILWMCPNSRYACLRSSPALVFYAEALLILQYIFGLNLKDGELPTFSKNIAQIGLDKYGDLSYQPLAIKMLYTVMFWITMRQFFEERAQYSQRDIAEAIKRHFSIVPSTTSPNPYIRIIAETVSNLLTKYWIWVVATMLMIISLGGEGVVVYRIVYMFLFLFFILMFQFSYQFWRRIMYGFWLTVIVFSMLVLILIYTYQFEDFDLYWETYLRVPKSLQRDLGLELYDSNTGTLFLKLLTPTFFLIITIIQLHYFHREFLLISDINYRSYENLHNRTQLTTTTDVADHSGETHITIEPDASLERPKSLDLNQTAKTPEKTPASPSSEVHTPLTPKRDDLDSNRAEREFRAVKVCLDDLFHEMQRIFTYVSEILWRILEIHIIKIVFLSTFCLAAYDVCAIHVAFVVFVVIGLPIQSLQSFFSHCCSVWAAVLLLSKMIYQLNIVDYLNWQVNCTSVLYANSSVDPSFPFNATIDNHDWIGFKRTHYLASYCKGYIGLILVLTIQAVVRIRQEVNRLNLNEPEPKAGVIFADATRSTADDNLLECLKYLANYFFYKFGLEVSLITIVACIGVRLDVFAFLSAVWLACLFLLKRKTLAKIWPFYVTYQCIVLIIQYIICLGLPPGLCIEYPWTLSVVEGLREWLFLPNFQNPPSTSKVVADFFILLIACCQLFVFRIETSPIADLYEGGSNKEINVGSPEPNPIPDFTCTKSCLDMIKVIIFYAFYWISLAIVFKAGTSRINLFAMGYVVSCFYFLWNGNEFYLKTRAALLRMWNILLAYNVTVIFLSSVLQLIGCTYFDSLRQNQCWIVQLLGIACQQKFKLSSGSSIAKLTEDTQTCKFEADPGLIYDTICFAFLLFQRRLFSSYYFQHVVNETKAQQVLASRGAELIHEIQMKEVQEQQVTEKEIMERIKKKMDRIRAYQQKIRGDKNMEPETHFEAIRSGDYYMFEFPDDDIDLELSARHKRVEEEDEDSAEVKEKGINALLCKTIRGNIKLVDEPRKVSGEVDDVEDSSQQSAIVSADRDAIASSSQMTIKSPDPLTITSSGPTMSLSLPSSASTSMSSPKEDTVAPLSPQDAKSILDEEIKEETFVEKVKRWFAFFCEFMNSLLISTTAKLNGVSKDYRFVAKQLSKEKKLLKERFIKNGSFDMDDAEKEIKKREFETLPGSSKDLKQVAVVVKKTNLDFLDSCELTSSDDILDKDLLKKNYSIFVRFLIALYYAAISRSELLCYMVIIVNQMKSASILSLPLPIFVFLWGTLSVPRPTKAFWITIITYTEAIVVLKYLFQFYFFPWNYKDPPPNDPFYPTVILGIRKDDNYAGYDLAVLLVVFFHRFMLKTLGLWKDTEKSLIIPPVECIPEKVLQNGKEAEAKVNEKKLAIIPEITKDAAEPDEDKLLDCAEELSDDEGSESSLYDDEPRFNIDKIVGSILDPAKMFFYHLLYPEYRVTVDVYAFMFFCDFINFFIVVFGYYAFGVEGSEAVTSYFKENKVPIPFLIMLIAQFATIVTDRALYLRKYILGKLIFQIISVFIVHMWMFFILPAITSRDFVSYSNLPPKMWYFIKCLYMLLSAHQIRSGYPTRILGNFFCKKYNYANLFLFKGYMIIPFLYELRSLMDWIWTDTSMNISNWLKMEDIYANIFILKCTRRAEADYPTPRGAKRTALIKYGVGGLLLFLIILIIWFPLLLFALGNTVGRSNPPASCTVELSITGYEPIFRTTALNHQIHTFSASQWRKLERAVSDLADPVITSFLTGYDKDDTVIINLSNNSTSVWTISPPSQSALIEELKGDNELKMVLSWSFVRNRDSQSPEQEVRDYKELNLTDRDLRNSLASALSVNQGNASTIKGSFPESTTITDIFPNFVKIPSTGSASYVKQFYNKDTKKLSNSPFRNLNISMWTGDMLNSTSIPNSSISHYVEWWEIQDDCKHDYAPYKFLDIDNCDFLRLIAFSDKAFPSELSIISGYGIVGLYTTFVLVVSRLVRGFVAGTSFTIMFDDMPYVDRVLQLCLDIYLVRESGEFTLEEDLFAKLIFLYRSPEMLIRWTRPPGLETEEQEERQLPGLQQ